MKKLTVLALAASLSLAAPAFAQTPADIKNFRDGTKMPEVTVTSPVTVHETKTPVKKTTKKTPAKKAVAAKPVTETETEEKDEMKKDEMKKEAETKKDEKKK